MEQTKDSALLKQFLHDENTDKDLEDLIKENQELHEQITQLRSQQQTTVALAEYNAAKEALQVQEKANKMLAIEKKELVKMFDTLTKDRDTAKTEAAKLKVEKSTLQE